MRWPVLVTLAFALYFVGLRTPQLFYSHSDGDEQIYLTLAGQLDRDPPRYTLRGTPLLPKLSQSIYDTPLYHYPPLWPYALAIAGLPFGLLLGWWLLSLATCLAAVVATWDIARRLRLGIPFWVFLGVASLCPILLLLSGRVWIDTPLVLMSAVAVDAALIARERDSRRSDLAVGALVGLGMWIKPSIGALLPLVMLVSCYETPLRANIRRFSMRAGLVGIGAVVTIAPWYLSFYAFYGTLFPAWIYPDAELQEKTPLTTLLINRPAYFYFTRLALLVPAYVVGLVVLWWNRRRHELASWVVVGWALSFVGAMTLFGMSGISYQIRYLSPMLPALLLAGSYVSYRALSSPGASFAILVLLLYGHAHGIASAVLRDASDLFPIQMFLGWTSFS